MYHFTAFDHCFSGKDSSISFPAETTAHLIKEHGKCEKRKWISDLTIVLVKREYF